MFFIKIYIKESYMNYYHTSIQMCGQYCILAPNPVIPNINNGAKITIRYYIQCEKLYLYPCTCRYVCKHKNVLLKNVLLA